MMRNNIKIAITGGVCSGKSTVAQIIEEQGYKVLSCDKIYSEILEDSLFIDTLAKEFGAIKNVDGTLNRARLSEIVFGCDERLKKLNSLTHPKIMQRAMEQMTGEGLFFCEVPLLFEGGFEQLFDNVIVVLRNDAERIAELMQRRNIDEKQAFLRINSQFDYKNCNFEKYYVIHNNANLSNLRSNTLLTLEKIIKHYY